MAWIYVAEYIIYNTITVIAFVSSSLMLQCCLICQYVRIIALAAGSGPEMASSLKVAVKPD